jgi:hypothetical protein
MRGPITSSTPLLLLLPSIAAAASSPRQASEEEEEEEDVAVAAALEERGEVVGAGGVVEVGRNADGCGRVERVDAEEVEYERGDRGEGAEEGVRVGAVRQSASSMWRNGLGLG